MMDARAHGESGGPMATYGWLERNDTRAIIDALEVAEHPRHIFALGESMGAGIAVQSAAVDNRIEGVVAEASFANIVEAAYDYAGFRRSPLLGKTLLAPGAWMMTYRAELIGGFTAGEVSPEKAVATRAFPVFLICDAEDVALPCRHTKRIFDAAIGPKEMWIVPGAPHAAAVGYEPAEFNRRVLAFYNSVEQANTSR
jgi:pimeloyl-ACP methyl ester carboxylesterase